MSITNSITGINIEDITLENLTNFFIDEKEESDIFELKSFVERGQNNYNHKENGVLKTICGFLNSSGGLIIWGAPVGLIPKGRTEKVFTGALSPVERNLEKDAFIGKITNRIIPTPTDIKFKKITVAENQFAYLLEVPESKTKPHQFDNRYFMRLDGQTKVAPHHYIEALFKQIKYPELGGYIKFGRLSSNGGLCFLNIMVFIFNHSPLQNEENVSFNLTINRGTFHNHNVPNGDDRISYHLDGHQLRFNNIAEILHYGSPPYHSAIVVLRPADLVANNNEVAFLLHFGGKFSPMKNSEYKMRLNNPLPEDSTSLVYSVEENRIMYDLGKDKGEEKEKVNAILER